MAGMAKCPLSFECGAELLIFGEHDSYEFTISNVSPSSLCIYNIYLPEET